MRQDTEIARSETRSADDLVRSECSNLSTASSWASVFLIWVALCLLVSPFLVFPLVKGAGLYDNQRLVQVSCALFALLVAAGQWTRGGPRRLLWNRRIAGLLGLFFLFGLISTALAYSPRHALFEWANLLLMLGMSWVIASQVSTRGEVLLDKLLLAAGLACATYLLLEILVYVALLKAGVQPSARQLIVGYNNYRFFNHVQTITLPLLGLLAARMRQGDRRMFWWTIVVLWWMLLFVGLGRGTLMGQFVGIALTWFLLRKAAVTWCRSMLLAGAGGLAAYLLFYVLIPILNGMEPFGLFASGLERTVRDPTSARIPLWLRALELIQTNPWLGTGPAHFAHYSVDIPFGAAHPHNWILQIGSEWGLPALLAFVSALAMVMHRLWQLRSDIGPRDQDTLTVWLVTGWAILVDGLVSGLLMMPTSLLWIGFYAGCAWGWVVSRISQAENTLPPKSILQRGVGCAVTLALIYGLLRSVYPDLQGFSARQLLEQENVAYRPRLWLNGRF